MLFLSFQCWDDRMPVLAFVWMVETLCFSCIALDVLLQVLWTLISVNCNWTECNGAFDIPSKLRNFGRYCQNKLVFYFDLGSVSRSVLIICFFSIFFNNSFFQSALKCISVINTKTSITKPGPWCRNSPYQFCKLSCIFTMVQKVLLMVIL